MTPEAVAVPRKLGFQFIPIPVAVYQRKDLSLIDKMLVGRILSFGAATCYLAQGTFADELGVHRQHINERLKLLAEKGLIQSKRGRYGKSYRVVSDVRYSGHLESVRHLVYEMSGKADTSRCLRRIKRRFIITRDSRYRPGGSHSRRPMMSPPFLL